MFDVGFWEMAFIGVIALVVIGPERLPGVARSVGLWVGKGRRMLNEVMSDVKKEMKEYDLEQVKSLSDDLKSAGNELKDITQSASDSLDLKDAGSKLKKSVDDLPDSESASIRQEIGKINRSKRKASPAKSVASKKTAGETTAKKKPITKKNRQFGKRLKKPPQNRPQKEVRAVTRNEVKSTNKANQMTDGTRYYIYENSVHNYAKLHKATCAYCNAGAGMHGVGKTERVRDEWHGPYDSLADSKKVLKSLRVKKKSECGSCMRAR